MTNPSRGSRHLLAGHNEVDRIRHSMDANVSGLRPSDLSREQLRSSTRISPPPLKRQRVDTTVSNVLPKRPSLTDVPAQPSLRPGKVECRPNTSFNSGSSSKRTCRVCEKASATKYNPIITCPSCQRPYHDSCRKPRLVEGVDPKCWKCWKCQSKTSKRKPTSFAASRASLSFSKAAFDAQVSSEGSVKVATNVDPDVLSRLNNIHVRPDHVVAMAASDNCNHAILDATHGSKPPSINLSVSERKDEQGEHSDGTCNDRRNFIIDEKSSTTLLDKLVPAVDNEEPGMSILQFKEPKATLKPPEPVPTTRIERTEIPNTPTQRSSQIYIPELSPRRLPSLDDDVFGADDNSLLVENLLAEGTSSNAVSCSRCQKHQLFAKRGSKPLTCKTCHSRSFTADAGPLVIPESPDVTSSDRAKTQNSSQAQGPTSSTSNPTPAAGPASSLDSQPELIEDTHYAEISRLSCKLEEPSIEEDTTDVVQTVDRAKEASTSNADEGSRTHLVEEGPGDSLSYSIITRDMSVKEEPENTITRVENVSQSSPLPRAGRANTSVPDESTADLSRHTTSATLIGTIPNARSPLASRVSGSPICAATAASVAESNYTNRELTRIALVAANGLPLTTAEIVAWILQTLPHLRKKGEGWEKSISATVSKFDEFTSSNIVGSLKKQYMFRSASLRAQYEKEYSRYHTKPGYPTAQSGSPSATVDHDDVTVQPCKEDKKPSRRAVKSAPTQTTRDRIKEKRSQPVVLIARKSAPTKVTAALQKLDLAPRLSRSMKATHPKDNRSDDPQFIPFERSASCQPRHTIGFNHGMKRGTSPQYWKSSIETMTQADIDEKIAEIKTRPPRKKFFGPDYRLAHVRRYGRQDVHDEREGMWKHVLSNRNEVMERDEENWTLREVFSLPKNAIPMNDGQSELAFRDGTLVNGRLPRPRQIYKVGKMFGGELTIRTS
ncbi:hypothetical protein P153DRAFT_387959 [Dothidotthia symphoricarpi CBS 119687]|uniref:PHD-type domain-containing protein n=1 Tax=Dothidotthia symphoricarpi CBS 119687 TaxID=1392245 RepID=A0A6A6A772_9PLEO|nr:uncharacterized protein P153DRAFT_387959 [Dothidotthia symphoricarpi CBS 119687]KAF2127416.1 hypothetical protein P153DRAFT_387959 [Dothidotthia symphoricarpi CBS 119687]